MRVAPEVSGFVAEKEKQALEVPSPASAETPEETIPAHMQPLFIQLGGIKRVYRCQVEGCTEGPSTSHATICKHVHRMHLGWGWCVPVVAIILQSGHTQVPQEKSS